VTPGTLDYALRPRAGRWTKVEATRGKGGCRCSSCSETVFSGWAFYEGFTSTAFLCDPCVEMIVDADEIE
jgi:hypothetical protein